MPIPEVEAWEQARYKVYGAGYALYQTARYLPNADTDQPLKNALELYRAASVELAAAEAVLFAGTDRLYAEVAKVNRVDIVRDDEVRR